MKQEEFALALNALLPGCDPEAAEKWVEFAAECVDHEQFAYFIPMARDAAIEKWLEATFAGLWAVNQEHGPEIAAKVAGLSCQRCSLYPGEMLVAAVVLKDGGDAERIGAMMASGELDAEEPFFFDLPDGVALTQQGPEIGIVRSGVPCGLLEKRTEPGFLLADGTALLESERDDFGRWRGGAGVDGMYLQTGRLYAPVRRADGVVRAFQEVKPLLAREREAAFLASPSDTLAIYRLDASAPEESPDYVPVEHLRQTGKSPLDGNHDLVHVIPLPAGTDPFKTLDACRAVNTLKPGDIAVFKQSGTVTCWYVDHLAFSKLPHLMNNYLAGAEMGVEQNSNHIDGIINNEAPRPSLRDTLRQYQEDAKKQEAPSPGKRPEQER